MALWSSTTATLRSADWASRRDAHAGVLGLPFGFAHHFDMGGTIEACEVYRSSFRPSPILDEPYTIVTASTLAAETAEHAEWLSGPARLRRFGLRTGRLVAMLTPEEAVEHPNFEAAQSMRVSSLVGTPDEVVAGMRDLAHRTGASELMLHTSAYALEDRIESCLLYTSPSPRDS